MRLTEKKNDDYVLKNEDALTLAINKLGQLEDKEKLMDVELSTLFQALIKGIYYKDYKGEIKYIDSPSLQLKVECYNEWLECHWVIGGRCWVENYGKDWALTEEELK